MILTRLSTVLIATAAISDAAYLRGPQNSDDILTTEMAQADCNCDEADKGPEEKKKGPNLDDYSAAFKAIAEYYSNTENIANELSNMSAENKDGLQEHINSCAR